MVLIDLLQGPYFQDLWQKGETMFATDADDVLEENEVITMVAVKDFHDRRIRNPASIIGRCRYTLL